MERPVFNYRLPDGTVVFTDTLKKDSPYISAEPRNHESLFIVTAGNLEYEKDGKTEVVCEGQVGYIGRGAIDKSSAYRCDEVSYIAVNFCFDRQNPAPQKTLPFNTVCSQGAAYNYEKLFQQALNCFLSNMPGRIAVCNGLIIQIIGLLYNEHQIDDVNFAKMRKIERAVEYLKQHYSDPCFRISDLADTSEMSEKHFRRLFVDVYKKTPFAFVQEFRINKAEILLSNTSKSISDIALQCGFSDIYSFSHCFKKRVGISPEKYRTQLMQNS